MAGTTLKNMSIERLTSQANAADQAFNFSTKGKFFDHVEIITSADDSVAVTINSADGIPLHTASFTGATGGEIDQPTRKIACGTNVTWTLANQASGTATIVFCFSHQ